MKFGFRTHLLRLLCALGLGLIVSSSAAVAQNDWQMAYDPYTKNASARGGIIYLANNAGTITAGEMQLANTTTDIYIIKQDACGYPLWEYRYDIGNIDSCRKIRATPDGGFIVVGSTQNILTICPNQNQIFLMKLDANGAVVWTKLYGGPGIDEGNDIQYVGASINHPAGYIVAGMTQSYGAGQGDGFIMRTDLSGTARWLRTYGGVYNDYFRSCSMTSNGNVLAVGGSMSFTVGNNDVWLARVDANSGIPSFTSNYGTSSADGGTRAVERANGEIAVCGYTSGYGSGGDGLIFITDPNGVFSRGHYYGGGGGGSWDEFTDMMVLGNTDRDLMVTGLSYQPTGGFGNYDAYVGQVSSVTLAPVKTLLFGGPFNDQGWAITRNPNSSGTGFQVAGLTYLQRPGFVASLDVYVISRPNMNTRGCDAALNPVHGNAPLSSARTAVSLLSTVDECSIFVEAIPQYDFYPLCGECSPTRVMPDNRPLIGEHISPADADAVAANISSVDGGSAASAPLYPNPVRSGNTFTIALPAGSAPARITVTDMTGSVVYTATATATQVSIDTDGWSSGAYAIRLSRGNGSITRQIVVTE